MWAKLENKTLPLQNQGHANCTTNERCTGFHCDGMYQVKWRKIGAKHICAAYKMYHNTASNCNGLKAKVLLCSFEALPYSAYFCVAYQRCAVMCGAVEG